MTEINNIIKSPIILNLLETIKKIQKRMKDPDVKDLEYIHVYDKLGKEFDDFFNQNTSIFVKVIKGEDLKIISSVLYYKDQVLRGLLTEDLLSDKLATMYLPPELKRDADLKMRELK